MSDRPLVIAVDLLIHPIGIELLKEKFEVMQLPYEVTVDEVLEKGQECQAIFARRWRNPAELFNGLPKLKILVRHGVGYDAVDMKAATANGVAVCNNPQNSITVAEHAWALLMASTRRVIEANASMQRGEWDQPSLKGMELHGKTIGIIGLGRIGSLVSKMAKGVNMTVIAHDPYVQDNRFSELGIERVSREDLIARSDIVTLHCFLSDETKGMIDADAFAAMKDKAVFINCSRGPVVDEPAMIAALKSGKLRCAAIDTMEVEPLPAENDLRGVPNLIMSPHIAGFGEEVGMRSSEAGARTIIEELEGRRPPHLLNPDAYDNR